MNLVLIQINLTQRPKKFAIKKAMFDKTGRPTLLKKLVKFCIEKKVNKLIKCLLKVNHA